MKTDTIAAIATALSDSGIGIIRVSGEEAFKIVDRIFVNSKKEHKLLTYNTHTIHYGFIINEASETIDEVIVSIMKAPHSYTMEDTIEINCHGGVLMVHEVLETVLVAGARLAEPGEFSKRAFLNGRIDLAKAEAVIDVIHSKNEFALKSSVNQLQGKLSDKIRSLRENILYEIAFIESALDDPEHISLEGYTDKLQIKVDYIRKELKKLLDTAANGKMLKEGINTVIVGKPNAGKSSLLNLLVGEEKAIVTSVAGTTRDVLEENIKLHGIGINIVDTAGIHSTEDIVEQIGVNKAKKYALNADLIIYVVDSSVPLDESDFEIIDMIQEKNVIVLLNKNDLETVVTKNDLCDRLKNSELKVIKTSTKDNVGIDVFENTIKDMFFHGKIEINDEIYITNMRHKEALMDAYSSMNLVDQSLIQDMPEDFYSIDLMSAYEALGRIIGEEVGEDLVNEIFAKFCMGK